MGIQPEGEVLRKATKWISEERKRNPSKKVSQLIMEAALKFDLSPKDEEFLMRFLAQKKE